MKGWQHQIGVCAATSCHLTAGAQMGGRAQTLGTLHFPSGLAIMKVVFQSSKKAAQITTRTKSTQAAAYLISFLKQLTIN